MQDLEELADRLAGYAINDLYDFQTLQETIQLAIAERLDGILTAVGPDILQVMVWGRQVQEIVRGHEDTAEAFQAWVKEQQP